MAIMVKRIGKVRLSSLIPRPLVLIISDTFLLSIMLGINTVLLSNGWITSSAARMNDHFFVEGSDEDKRQYTMCHEVRINCFIDL